MIVLDTSAIIDFVNGNKHVGEIVRSAEESGKIVAVTSVSFFELFEPIFRKGMSNKERVYRSFLNNTQMLLLDQQASEESAKIMSSLHKVGKPVNVLDVLIAGIAYANNAELLLGGDQDLSEIAKVSELKIQVY